MNLFGMPLKLPFRRADEQAAELRRTVEACRFRRPALPVQKIHSQAARPFVSQRLVIARRQHA